MSRVRFRTSLLLGALVSLLAAPAFADPPRGSDAVTLEVSSADHLGVGRGDGIEWTSRFAPALLTPTDGRPTRLELANSLPRGAEIRAGSDATIAVVRNADGRIIAVDFLTCPFASCATQLRTFVPFGEAIEPPLATSVAQRLLVRGARFRPTGPTPVKLRLTSARHEAVSGEVADRIEHLWGESEGRPIFVVPDEAYFAAGGITAHLLTDVEPEEGNVALFGGALVVILGLLGGMFRVASRGARAEAAHAFLRDFELPGPEE